nr:putative ribonuclease H-like domain-containing protein [Tanacetum cinerariifolium]
MSPLRKMSKQIKMTFHEASQTPKWIEAMNLEMETLHRNNTYGFADLPPRKKVIGCKWILKIKYKSSGEIDSYVISIAENPIFHKKTKHFEIDLHLVREKVSFAINTQQQPNIQPQIITTISNNNAKFPYLKKDEYEVWAMKMEYWITNNDMNIWKVIQNGNSLKRTVRDRDRGGIILPPTTAEEHIAVQMESKVRTTLLQSIPDDHVADFHYMDDARDIWNAVKAMRQKILSQLNQLKAKPEDEDINLKFLRALPSSWSQTLEIDVKGYTSFSSSQSAGPSHSAFVSATSASKKMSYGDSPSYSSNTTYSASLNSKTGSHRSSNVLDDVLQSFVADIEPEQLAYEDFEQKDGRKIDFDKKESTRFNKKKVRCYKCQQRGHFAKKCRANGGNDKQRYSSFKIKEIKKKKEDSKALITVDTLVDWTDHDEVITAKEFGMIAGCASEDAIKEGAAKIYNLITEANSKEANTVGDAGEFALRGITSETAKKDLQTKLDNRLVQTKKWRNSSKNLFRLIDSSMSVRTKVGLGFTNRISENELGWDDSTFSVFTTISKDVEGRPIFHRFAKTDSMKVVPPPLSEDYTSLSDHIDLDELQMSYGINSSISCDFKSVSNDLVSCDDSDKSSEVNTNDFASSDSSVKSSEPKPNDSTSCASTSSVSTSVNEAEIESNVGTHIQEPIIVQDLPSFFCNSSDKHKNTSRTSCNKNGYVNKKAGQFRKNASSVSKLCFVCGSGTHHIKDCDFCEKQMANKTVGIGVGSVHRMNKVHHKNQFVPQAVLLQTGKVNIPPARPQPLPTGKPKVFAHVPSGRPNRPFPLPTDRRYSPSVISSWWKRIDGQLLLSPQQVVLRNYIKKENPFSAVEDEGIFDSGCSRSMTGNKERLDDFQAFQGGKVTFEGGEGRITRKGTIRTPTLDFKNVYYVKELQQFNLFSISQICDKKNQVLFTYTECLVLSKDFKLPDDSMVVLRVPRKHNLYTINLNNLCPRGNLACLVAHASFDESMKWHRRMGHVNYKNMNRLVNSNLVRGLPPKLFKNDHTCVACCKGKQHKASYKAINAVSSISEPLQLLHMDLFGPTSIRSINHKYFCLVITDDYSRFCWVFFLEHRDKTYPILKDFINLVENQLNKKREYSNPRTLQQNGVAERKNKTLIEAARTMLADFKLPTMFWTKAVRTACYVLNKISVTSPHNKTPYALLTGHIHSVSHFKPFGCHVTILNICDHLGKFDGKADEGYIVGYSTSNKAYRVYNMPNKRVEESMNLRFLKEKPTVQGLGHEWYFDLDYLTDSLGYKHVQANQSTGTQGATTTSAGTPDTDSDSDYDEQVIIVPSYPSLNIQQSEPKDTSGDEVDDSPFYAKTVPPGCIPGPTGKVLVPPGSLPVPTGSIPIPAAATKVSTDDVLVYTSSSTDSIFDDEPTTRFSCPSDLGNHDPSHGIFSSSSYDDEFGAALNNVASTVEVSPVATKRINTIHPQSLILGIPTSAVQTRSKECSSGPRRSKLGKYAIVTKWILKNKRGTRGIVSNKARLVAQGHRQEEGIDYDEVFAPVTRIEAIRLFLAFASYIGFLVYQMDVKSAFLYERIDEEVYVTQPKGRGTINKTLFLKKNNRDIILAQVYVDDIIFGSIKKAWYDEFEALIKGEFQISDMGKLNFFLVKKIFKYLKGQPKLGLWYLKESPLVLKAYSDSDYAGANKDRKSITGGCQFLGGRLISWQCKKQTIMATSSTEAEYVTAANCCCQLLWSDLPVSSLHYDHQLAQNLNPISTSSMAALRYKDEHNKVGYLLKPTESDDYHQIIEFLRDSHIMAPKLGPLAILATIDKTPYTITEDLGMVSNIRNAKKDLLYPRFLQTILDIETRVTRQYKVLVFSSKLFANMRLNFARQPMPLLPAMLFQVQAGEGVEVATQAVPQHMPSPDQPQAHLSSPPRQQTSDPQTHAPVLEHSQSSDPTTASFSRSHETDTGPFTNVEDAPIHSLETWLKDHKKLFKDVVGKLVKKVKALEVKLKTKKRKMVVSDSDQEDDDKQDVDLDTLRALANAAVTVDSNIPSGGTSQIPAASPSVPTAGPPGASIVPPGTSVVPTGASTVPAGSPSVPADVLSSVAHAGVSSKGKSPMVEEGIHVKARTFKQMKEDRLGEEATKRLHDEEQANLDRQRAELQCERQEEVLDSAMYYTEADWLNIMDQVEANAYLSKSLLSDDVSEDNFSAIMAALIKRNRQALAAKLAQERQNKPMTQAQQRAYMRQYFQKIRKVQSNSQIQAFSRTLKRPGPVLEEPSSKRQQCTEAPILSVPEVPHSPVVSSPLSSHKRRKFLGRKHIPKPKSTILELDLDADAQTFIKVVVIEDSDDEASPVWSPVVGWEVLPTPLGDINALYRIDGSTKHFTTHRQILHMVDRQDLVKLYGLVVHYYENHPVAGAGLILWGDIQVLFDSHVGGKGSCVWQHQNLWEIRSWRLYTLSNVYVLETIYGKVLYMFTDVSYPLLVKLMERMLMHKLEIDSVVVGNDITTAEQLIHLNSSMQMQFSLAIFADLCSCSRILVKTQSSRYVVPTGRVIVSTGRYVVPTGRVIVLTDRSTGIYYHLKELRYCAQCLIIDEDFIKRTRSTLGEECDHFIEPTELKIQEMNHFSFMLHGEYFEYWKAGLVVVGKKINDLQLITCGDMFKDSNSYLKSREALKIWFHSGR